MIKNVLVENQDGDFYWLEDEEELPENFSRSGETFFVTCIQMADGKEFKDPSGNSHPLQRIWDESELRRAKHRKVQAS